MQLIRTADRCSFKPYFMRSLIIAVVCMLPLYSSAQEETMAKDAGRSIQLKLYNTASASFANTRSNYYPFGTYTYPYSFEILHPSFAINVKNKKSNFHELELRLLNIKQSETKTIQTAPQMLVHGNELYEMNFALRYEYIINLNKKQDAKVVPAIGMGVSPYFDRYNYTPLTPTFSPARQTYIGAELFVTPRLLLRAHKRIVFDINLPLCLMDSYFDIHTERNPTIPSTSWRQTATNIQFMPQYFSVRLGVGVKI